MGTCFHSDSSKIRFRVHISQKHSAVSTALVDRDKAMDIVYLGLCKALDTVLHDILVSKLERHGFDPRHTYELGRCVIDSSPVEKGLMGGG